MRHCAEVLAVRLPARRLPPAGPGLRPVDPQGRRRRGAPLPPLRARAADPGRGPAAGDGGGDGGPRRRPAAGHRSADGVHAQPLPALLHRAGRRRPHGGRRRRRAASGLARVSMAFCFVDLTGFTRYTEEEGDEEALDLVERFVDTVEATLPTEATIVKTIGDEVMVVSPDPASLTEWAVGFLDAVPGAPAAAGRDPLRRGGLPRRRLLRRRRQPRPPRRHPGARRRGAGHRAGRRGGRRTPSTSSFEPIGEVALKGFGEPIALHIARPTAS